MADKSARNHLRTGGAPGLTAALRMYLSTEAGSAAVLLGAALLALVWANSPWSASYEGVWETALGIELGEERFALDLREWVNDGLMAFFFFFFVIGVEIRRELDMGELRERRRVAVPVLAAIGGMVLPALLFVAINAASDDARGGAWSWRPIPPSPSGYWRWPAAGDRRRRRLRPSVGRR